MMRTPLVLVAILFVRAVSAQACQCGGWPTVAEAKGRAVAVFEGVVVAKAPVLGSFDGYWFPVERWAFAVDRSWKGAGSTAIVTEGYSNCSKIFALGQRAIVYAYRHESRPGELQANKCGDPRTDPVEEARALGPPQQEYPAGTHSPESTIRREIRHVEVYALAAVSVLHNAVLAARDTPTSSVGLTAIAAAVFVALQFLAFFLRRRRRSRAALALAATVLLIATWSVVVAARQLRGGYFAHLTEYECAKCPGG